MSAAAQPVIEDRIRALEAEVEHLRGQLDDVLKFFKIMADLPGGERYQDAARITNAKHRHLRAVR